MDNVPFASTVKQGKSVYFKFYLTLRRSINIVVSPGTIYGDPDVYVSNDTMHPSLSNHRWQGRRSGEDLVSIHASELPAVPTFIYIAVEGYSDTDFRLLVYTEGEDIEISSGYTQLGVATYQQPKYYKFYHGDAQANIKAKFTIVRIRLYCSPLLFVKICISSCIS